MTVSVKQSEVYPKSALRLLAGPMAVLAVGMLIIGSLVLLYGAIEKQEKVHALSERILGIVAGVSTFHASFEEYLSGDPVMDPSRVWELLDNIQRDAEEVSREVLALSAKFVIPTEETGVLNLLEDLKGEIAELSAYSKSIDRRAYQNRLDHAVDRDFDRMIQATLEKAEALEKLPHVVEYAINTRSRRLFAGMLTGWIICLLAGAWGLFTLERRRVRMELDIYESRRDWESTFDAVPDLIAIVDVDDRILRANKALIDKVGMSKKDIQGITCLSLFHGSDESGDSSPCALPLSEGVERTLEIYNGLWGRHYLLTSSPFYDASGNFTGAVNVFHDITERRRAEADLRSALEGMENEVNERTADLRHANESLQKEILERLQAEAFTSAANALLQLFPRKFSKKEYLESVVEIILDWSGCRCAGIRIINDRGEIPYEVYAGFSREFREKENLLSVNEDQCACIRVISENIEAQDEPCMTDGGSFWCGDTSSFVSRLSDDERARYRGVCVEAGLRSVAIIPIRFREKVLGAIHLADEKENQISPDFIERMEKMTPLMGEAVHRFNVEDALQEQYISLQQSNRLLETMFANMHVLVAYLDGNFNVVRVNRAFALAMGGDPESYSGRSFFALFPDNKDRNKEVFNNVMATGQPYVSHEEIFESLGGAEEHATYWDCIVEPVKNEDGEAQGMLVSLLDITGRKQAEAEAIRKAHLASLGELAAGVAHEINNPINGIINYAQILINKGAGDSRDMDIFKRIMKEGDRVALIVRSLLSFARPTRQERTQASIWEILTDSLALIDSQIHKDVIDLRVDISADLPLVFVNPQQIEQVFLNIISNSRHALNHKYPPGHEDKILKITGSRVEEGGRSFVRIVFHDHGAGMSPEVMNRALNPFFSTKPRGEGTGLGLSISHGIIRDHGGHLDFESREGRYSKAIIDLPAAG